MSPFEPEKKRGPGRPRKHPPKDSLPEDKLPSKEERERRYADVQFKRQTMGLPHAVGHSLDMLWEYFTGLSDTTRGYAGREHVLGLVDYMEYLRAHLERARARRYEGEE